MSIIGRQIFGLRTQLGWTQEELAEKMGYKHKSSINKIELGIADITQSKIVQFAEVLGTTPAYLMGWEENIAPDELRVTESDKEILELFKQIPEKDRRVLLEMVRSYANTLNKD